MVQKMIRCSFHLSVCNSNIVHTTYSIAPCMITITGLSHIIIETSFFRMSGSGSGIQ